MTRLGSFILLHELVQRWRVLQARVALGASLHHDAHVAGLVPASVRLAAKIGREQRRPAVDFAALDRQFDIGGARVAADDLGFDAERFFYKYSIINRKKKRKKISTFRVKLL